MHWYVLVITALVFLVTFIDQILPLSLLWSTLQQVRVFQHQLQSAVVERVLQSNKQFYFKGKPN